MQLPESTMTTTIEAPENSRLGAVEPELPSAKPPAKKSAQAKTTKPKAVKNVAPSKVQEMQNKVTSLLSPSPTKARKKQAQAKGGEPLNPASTSDNIVQPPSGNPAASNVESPLLASAGHTGLVERSIDDGADTAAPAAESNANDLVPSKSITDTSAGSVLAMRPGRQAMAEIAGNSPGLNSKPPALSSTAQPAISKPTPSAAAEEVTAEEFMSGLDKFIRNYQHLPAPEPRPTAADDLAAYAAQPDEVRQAIIKDMVLDFLGDENFIKLAEDMSKEWRRIGLGL